jgi:hypothetical protein
MKRQIRNLILIGAGIFVLGTAQVVRADGGQPFQKEVHDGVNINISGWQYFHAYKTGESDGVPVPKLDSHDLTCAHQIRDQIFERAKTNALLMNELHSKKFLLQIDVNRTSDGNSRFDFSQLSDNVVSDSQHLYVRAPFYKIGMTRDPELACTLPDEFNAAYPSRPHEDLVSLKIDQEEQAIFKSYGDMVEQILAMDGDDASGQNGDVGLKPDDASTLPNSTPNPIVEKALKLSGKL